MLLSFTCHAETITNQLIWLISIRDAVAARQAGRDYLGKFDETQRDDS